MTVNVATSQTSSATDGRLYTIGSGDRLFVGRDVTLTTTGSGGVPVEVDHNAGLQIDGVVAGGGVAIYQDFVATLGLIYVGIGATGTLTGSTGIDFTIGGDTFVNAGEIRGLVGSGIQVSGGGNTLLNTGMITGANSGVYFGSDDNAVENQGVISATSGGLAYGLFLVGTGNSISNSGIISAVGGGTAEAVRFNAGGNTLANDGTIRSSDVAINVMGGAAGSVNLIVNTGLIETTDGVAAIQLVGSNDTLLNAGTIVGAVLFGYGNDNYDGADGRILSGIVVGGPGNDTLVGGAGRDILQGDSGADSLEGGAGDDILRPGLDLDVIDGGAGTADLLDYVGSGAVTVDLATGEATGSHAQGDIFTGVEAIAGGNFADALTGDTAANRLFGRSGSDVLAGGAGNDLLVGDAGADTLVGGAGVDILRGGADADVFRFLAASDSGAPGQVRDRIADFATVNGDRIDVSAIDANATLAGNQAFAFQAGVAFTAVGQVRTQVINGTTFVFGNTDAALATAEFSIALTGSVVLSGTDFIL